MNLDRQKKLDAVAELLIRIQHEIFENPENWCAFLDMASRISDRSFEDQALIYAQFPAATAVADYVTWQDRGRYVRYGAQGIVLIDNKSDPARLRYVFDVANTRKKDRDYVPWEINPTNQTAVQDALRDAGADGDDISSQIIDIAAASVLNYWEEHQQALEDLESTRRVTSGESLTRLPHTKKPRSASSRWSLTKWRDGITSPSICST